MNTETKRPLPTVAPSSTPTREGAPNARPRPLHVAISGASGLVGSALRERLEGRGDRVTRLVRRPPAAGEIHWDPHTGELDGDPLDAQAVVHLAGENIASGRWTRSKKEAIRASRVRGTHELAQRLARLETPPKVLVCASAIGFYGDRGEERLAEEAPAGTGFLPEVCRAWEEAAQPAREAGIRVVHARIGVVLDTEGGALPRMLLPFRLGLGGRIGSGRQVVSWIHLEDLVSILTAAIDDERLEGPVNATAPEPVTNAELTHLLGLTLKRPTLFPMPALAARLALGQMAQDLLLASTRAVPAKLERLGFRFAHPGLEGALRSLLRPAR